MKLIKTPLRIIKMDAMTIWELNHGKDYREVQMKMALLYLFVTAIGCAFMTAIMLIWMNR